MVGLLDAVIRSSPTWAERGSALVGLLPLDATPAPVYPSGGSGFAAYIVGGFFGLGILVLFMIWTSRRPRRPS